MKILMIATGRTIASQETGGGLATKALSYLIQNPYKPIAVTGTYDS